MRTLGPGRVGLAAAVAFAAVALLVHVGVTRGLDHEVLLGMQPLRSTNANAVARLFSYFGDSWVQLPLAFALVYLWRGDPRYRWVPLLVIAVMVAESIVKVVVDDPPPPRELRAQIGRALDFLPRFPTLAPGHANEFPSGYTARAAFVAVIVGARHPRARGVLAVIVFGMMATRVYAGSQYLSSTAGGLLLGAAIALVGVAAARVGIPRLGLASTRRATDNSRS